DPSIQRPHFGLARLAVATALQPAGREGAVRGEYGAIHAFEEADGTLRAITRIPLALAARSFADVEILQQYGETQFQDFRIGKARIGHMGMDAGSAVKAGAVIAASGRRAGADGLVILILPIAEGEIVHRALGIGQRTHGAE